MIATVVQFSRIYLLLNIFVFTQAEVVLTEYGFIESNLLLMSVTGEQYHAFRGIPYASPPIGKLRFQSPQEHPGWQGIKNVTQFGSICVQISTSSVTSTIKGSEDCLFVNVYTKNTSPKLLAPVVVLIHGGQFVEGSGDSDPKNFMQYDVVFVTFNYRLGIFGFLSAGSSDIPGNYALKDQLAALKWVKNNIQAFGGNPESVTLMGHSTGANNVHYHMLSPASKGLFHRAILMSGSALSLWAYFPKMYHYTQFTFMELLSKVNCFNETNEESLLCLQMLSKEELKAAEVSIITAKNVPFIFRPALEPAKIKDPFIVESPQKLIYQNPQIPLIIGICSTEGLLTTNYYLEKYSNGSDFSKEFIDALPWSLHYRYWIDNEETIGFITSMLMTFYNSGTEITLQHARQIIQMHGDILFRMPGVETAVRYPGVRYMYYYNYTNNFSLVKSLHDLGVTGANHGDDFTSLFSQDMSVNDLKIAEEMLKRFTSFIITGNPNSEDAKEQWMSVKSEDVDFLDITQNGFKMGHGIANSDNFKFYKTLTVFLPDIKSISTSVTTKVQFPKWYIIVVILFTLLRVSGNWIVQF